MGSVSPPYSPPLSNASDDEAQLFLAERELSSESDDLERTPDTPTLLKASLQPEAHGSLSQERGMTMDEIGSEIKQIPVKSFLEDFLPPLHPAVDVDEVVNRLKISKTLTDHQWKDLDLTPKLSNQVEDPTYKPVVSIVAAILGAGTAQSSRKSVLKYVQWPRKKVEHTDYPNGGLPDGYGYIPDPANPRRAKAFWHQLVFSAQFKKLDTPEKVNENNKQICSDMAQIMRDDPTRRFCYGYTIENRSTKLWYFDRSEIVVSEAFDFMNAPRSFIHFVLSLALSASLWDIGIDTTMTRSNDGKYYDITVNDKKRGSMVYRTQKYVHYFQAEPPRGRCTRVWEVQKLGYGNKPEGKTVVLKDTWIDHDRDREGDIMHAMINDLPTPEDKEALRKLLLTVLCHGDVLGPNRQPDSTRIVPSDCSKYKLKQDTVSDQNAHDKGAKTLAASGAYGTMACKEERHDTPIFFDRKIHYRIVFEEVGTPLNRMDHFMKIFKALYNVSQALGLMSLANWVHRDLSVHNIIWYQPPDGSRGYAKLCDLEYAKREDDKRCHTVRSGSNFYMACEVAQGYYHVIQPEPLTLSPPVSKRLNHDFDARDPPSSQSTTDSEAYKTPVGSPEPDAKLAIDRTTIFKYNVLHDLESLWWIAVYFLFYMEIFVADRDALGNRILENPDNLAEKQTTAKRLFHCNHTYGTCSSQEHTLERQGTLYSSGHFKGHVDKLLPSVVRETGYKMEKVRNSLIHAYIKITSNPVRRLSPDDKAALCSRVTRSFEHAYTSPDLTKSLRLRPLSKHQRKPPTIPRPGHTADAITNQLMANQLASASTKRRREDSDDATEDSDDTAEDSDKLKAVKRRRNDLDD